MEDNGWSQHKIDVLNRLDRMEGLLKEMQVENRDTNRKISRMCTEQAVIKTKIVMLVVFITVTLNGAWQLIPPLFK